MGVFIRADQNPWAAAGKTVTMGGVTGPLVPTVKMGRQGFTIGEEFGAPTAPALPAPVETRVQLGRLMQDVVPQPRTVRPAAVQNSRYTGLIVEPSGVVRQLPGGLVPTWQNLLSLQTPTPPPAPVAQPVLTNAPLVPFQNLKQTAAVNQAQVARPPNQTAMPTEADPVTATQAASVQGAPLSKWGLPDFITGAIDAVTDIVKDVIPFYNTASNVVQGVNTARKFLGGSGTPVSLDPQASPPIESRANLPVTMLPGGLPSGAAWLGDRLGAATGRYIGQVTGIRGPGVPLNATAPVTPLHRHRQGCGPVHPVSCGCGR